jgi:hypothetical protein
MATYSGSGKFVAITASNNGYDYIYEAGMHGVTFGHEGDVYCTISPHYELGSGDTIADTSLNIESGIFDTAAINMPLYVGFTNLQRLYIGDRYSGYTGDIRVANYVTVDSNYMPTTQYKTYKFYCGILTNV